ncbi:centrosomal protein of 162 kDa-like isoform X2 [Biomphalaria glabrata]|uniref:Centrosomal protein of 162 kDa n=1 Tax=Biomphalaria glabrata TaxID=6526 RepID=A0A9U8EM17_BIOGL|nr:centrosomal protein of 162 kDa-like isoform X2 [Biomphalaria glabrata]
MAGSRRWSKEELDSTFEEFVKSKSDDNEKIKELLKTPVKRKDETKISSLWWADSNDDTPEKGSTKTFLKSKKSSESPVRVKSSSSKSNLKANNSKTNTATGLKALAPSSKQIQATKTGAQRDPLKPKNLSSPLKTRSKSRTEVTMSKDSLEDISEKSEEHLISQAKAISHLNVAINDSSLETSASFDVPPTNTSHGPPGCDTLDEIADKHNFFQNLEKESDRTVDYGKLNQELSQTGGTSLLSPAVMVGQSQVDISTDGEAVAVEQSHVATNESLQKPSMLSKVALLDSLDSTFNTTTSPKIPNSRETTQDNLFLTMPDTLKNALQIGTNTSKEMEDLQRVLREVEMSPTLYGADSRPPTGKMNILSSTPLYEKRDVDRSVGEIIREYDAIDHRGAEEFDDDVPLRSDYKSPRSPRSHAKRKNRSGEGDSNIDYSPTEETELFKPLTSVAVKERTKLDKKLDKKGTLLSSVATNPEKVRSARDKFSHVQSSGYGRSASPPTSRKSRSLSAGKSPPKIQKSSVDQGTRDNTRKLDRSLTSYNLRLGTDNRMSLSSEGLSQLLPDHMTSLKTKDQYLQLTERGATKSGNEREATLLEVLQDMRAQLQEEKTLRSNLQVELMTKEKEFKKQMDGLKVKYEDEIQALKQENFVLTAKLKEVDRERELKSKKVENSSGITAEVEESTESRLAREIQEQENLLAGYQAENKKLYEEIKNLQKQAKATEASMFKENQRLTAELSNVKQELELKNTELQNKGIITSMAVQQQIAAGNAEAMMGASRVAHLEGELAEAKRVQDNLSKELKMAQHNRYELERHLESLLTEKDGLAKQLAVSLTPDQVKELESKHKEELDRLNKKIKWYAENQDLLDKSNVKLRQKDDEIHKLKMRLEDFKSEAGRKLEENKIRAKEKAADAKKIQDLERQVKEMEQVIRRRFPNSLPAMMMVAANAPDVSLDVGQTKGRSVQVLENRIRKLEKELEEKDELAQQDLRAMEQKYNQVKLQFEERIADLEHQLSYCQLSGEGFRDHPHSHALALERELDNVKDRCRRQVSEMQSEVDRLTAELNKAKKNQENLMKNDMRQIEGEYKQQLLSLQTELKNRDHDIQLLQHTVDKLRSRSGKKSNLVKVNTETTDIQSNFKVSASTREYKPGVFADTDLSSLIEENHLLKNKIDELQLELDQQRVDLRKSLAETESVARVNQERLENEINALRSSHQIEIQKILSEQALRSSTSRVAELQSQCDTQEVMIRHLQSQLKKLNFELEELPQLKVRESQMLKQIEDLQLKLKEARTVQAPEMRHFESLEEKLTDLVIRQKKREAELDSVVKHNQMIGRQELEEEVDKWRRMVEVKNQQLQVFRAELDSILEVLKTLQKQGITLPMGTFYS